MAKQGVSASKIQFLYADTCKVLKLDDEEKRSIMSEGKANHFKHYKPQ